MRFIFILVFLVFLVSCVSKKKYNTAIEHNKNLTEEKTSLEDLLNKFVIENDSLKQRNELLDSLVRIDRKASGDSKKEYSKTKKSSLSIMEDADKKAVYIYNFTSYVSWPKFKEDKFLIGIAGNSAVTELLTGYTKGKSIAKSPIVVQTYKPGNNYQMIFLASSSASEFGKIKKENNSKQVLLITENTLFNQMGGHISFFVDGNKVNFIVNKEGIENSGMHVSSQLINFSKN